jgi:hypothetical protein
MLAGSVFACLYFRNPDMAFATTAMLGQDIANVSFTPNQIV